MTDPSAFYTRPSLNLDSYDSLADAVSVASGDVDFYRELASTESGPVLDLGGGTGRVAWPLAEAGHAVTTPTADVTARRPSRTGGWHP